MLWATQLNLVFMNLDIHLLVGSIGGYVSMALWTGHARFMLSLALAGTTTMCFVVVEYSANVPSLAPCTQPSK